MTGYGCRLTDYSGYNKFLYDIYKCNNMKIPDDIEDDANPITIGYTPFGGADIELEGINLGLTNLPYFIDNINTIILCNNKFKRFIDLSSFDYLHSVDLGNNLLKKIPKGIYSLKYNLGYNRIKKVSSKILYENYNSYEIENINLSFNRIEKLSYNYRNEFMAPYEIAIGGNKFKYKVKYMNGLLRFTNLKYNENLSKNQLIYF